MATGHYVRKMENEKGFHLLSGKDSNKDQSYFLCQVTEEQISKALFPIGELLKPDVRKIAEEAGLPTAKKKDSQGLCFIGKVSLPDFLQQQLKPKKGNTVLIDKDWEGYQNSEIGATDRFHYTAMDGKVVGEHNGIHNFTIGQRKGIDIGGMKEPLFVIGLDAETNILYVGMGSNHPGLWSKGLFIAKEDLHWINQKNRIQEGELQVMARTRYRQPLKPALLSVNGKGATLVFEEATSAIAPGQFAAWYVNDVLMGSGVINQK